MMKTLLAAIATIALASVVPAQNSRIHPSAINRPAITPSYAVEADGTIVQRFAVYDLYSNDLFAGPHGFRHDTQLIHLAGFPDGSSPWDYEVFVDWDHVGFSDLYAIENLTSEARPECNGASYTIPYLSLIDPRPWAWGGDGLPIMGVSTGRWWGLGAMSAFDGALDWSGTSGGLDGQISNTNPTSDNQTTGNTWAVQSYLAECGIAQLYFAPLLLSSFDDYPTTPQGRYSLAPAKPLLSSIGGHALAWPWAHEFEFDRTEYTVRYEPVAHTMGSTGLPLSARHDATVQSFELAGSPVFDTINLRRTLKPLAAIVVRVSPSVLPEYRIDTGSDTGGLIASYGAVVLSLPNWNTSDTHQSHGVNMPEEQWFNGGMVSQTDETWIDWLPTLSALHGTGEVEVGVATWLQSHVTASPPYYAELNHTAGLRVEIEYVYE